MGNAPAFQFFYFLLSIYQFFNLIGYSHGSYILRASQKLSGAAKLGRPNTPRILPPSIRALVGKQRGKQRCN